MKKTENRKPRLNWGLMLLGGVSAIALSQPAIAQEDSDEPVTTGEVASDPLRQKVVVVEGIRESLLASSAIKRNSQGVVDAITAEEMGKFPDTNLAESLQRITGVSIDRSNGEGSTVTVRGFGPDFNLVLLNGRQMPSAFLEGGAPASRSFDFGNLASEGIAGVDVYKSGRANLPTGGIGSTLNIKTARALDNPGLHFSVGAKGVYDDSVTTLGDKGLTPEISGIYTNTFANDTIGVVVAGSFQERDSGVAQFGTSSGWRGAFVGFENGWGALPQPPNDSNVINRPGEGQIYSVPQNGNYSLADINRERINGQASLQYRPISSFTATLDYFYSENTLQTRTSDLSVWFNHDPVNTSSAFGDGQIADIQFYNEFFAGNTDLSMGASRTGSVSENESFGINLDWQATDRLSFVLDAHSSSAESGADSPFGTSAVLSTADFSLNFQGLDFTTELPTLSIGFDDGTSEISAARMQGTGSTFQDSFIRTEIDQIQLFSKYEFDTSIVKSVDFGASYTKNDYRATFSNNQRDSWGGVGTPDDFADDIWTRANLAENFDEFEGASTTQQDFFIVDFDKLLATMDQPIGNFGPVCGGDGICINDTPLQTDRRTEEESIAAFFQVNSEFDLGPSPAQLVAGLRYETTDVTSDALVGVPNGTAWVAANEFALLGLNDIDNRDFTSLEGSYEYWLPNVDFRLEPIEDVVLRASYSRTMTRPNYSDIQGGQSVAQLFRVDGGTGTRGNPDLNPFLSWNIDLSAEWYYGGSGGSSVTVGFFDKEVENFIGTDVVNETPFQVFTPVGGARFNEAAAALGTTDSDAIRQYIFQNADPSTFEVFFTDENGFVTGNIFGVPGEDPLVSFRMSVPANRDTKNVDGWEFAWQHFLGETGLGWIANYTVVNGDTEFDVFAPSGTLQTPLVGLSDSANLVGFYDKNGIQVRVAYNWRDKFLTSNTGVSGAVGNPLFVEDFQQVDLNASYDVTDRLTVFVEGINVLDETRRVIGRSEAFVNFATQTGARYNIGARYTF